ncbi:MAG: hypothetical protein IJ017_02240 [Oscillospiraceae bacterium]|nr:hypothetical protein [Oscillospiraceae bacterium]
MNTKIGIFAYKFVNITSAPYCRVIIMLAIKYLYILLSVIILKDLWYVGSDGYNVSFVLWKEILGSIVFVLVSFFVLCKKFNGNLINSVITLLFILYYIPLNSAFSINNQPVVYFLLSNIYFILIIVATKLLSEVVKRTKKDKPQNNPEKLYTDKGVLCCCAALCIVFIIFKLAYNGFSLSVSMEAESVYSNRAEMVEFFDNISGSALAYFLTIIRNVASIAAHYYFFVSIIQKKWLHAALAVLCLLSQYSISSSKGGLLFVAVIVVLYICYKFDVLKYFDRFVEYGMLAVLIVCLIEHFLLRSDYVFIVIIRRMMYYPAWLSTMYSEYFLENGPVLWTQNVFLLQNIFEPKYAISPLEIISTTYFGGEIPSPNSGLYAEAIMHFAEWGILIYPVLLAVVFIVSERILAPYGKPVQIFMALKLVLQLQNVPLMRTDSILTYFLFLFILWIVPKLQIEKQYKKLVGCLKCKRISD